MRLQECLRLQVKDIDFGNHRIIVRSAKGANDRSTLLPETLIEPLQFQLKTTQLIRQKDLKEGYGETLFLLFIIPNLNFWEFIENKSSFPGP